MLSVFKRKICLDQKEKRKERKKRVDIWSKCKHKITKKWREVLQPWNLFKLLAIWVKMKPWYVPKLWISHSISFIAPSLAFHYSPSKVLVDLWGCIHECWQVCIYVLSIWFHSWDLTRKCAFISYTFICENFDFHDINSLTYACWELSSRFLCEYMSEICED